MSKQWEESYENDNSKRKSQKELKHSHDAERGKKRCGVCRSRNRVYRELVWKLPWMDEGTKYHLLEWKECLIGYKGLGTRTWKDGEGNNTFRGRGGEAGRIIADAEESVVPLVIVPILYKWIPMSLLAAVVSSESFLLLKEILWTVQYSFLTPKLAYKTASSYGRGMSIWNITDSQAYNKNNKQAVV